MILARSNYKNCLYALITKEFSRTLLEFNLEIESSGAGYQLVLDDGIWDKVKPEEQQFFIENYCKAFVDGWEAKEEY